MLNVKVGDAPAEMRAAVLAMKRADAAVRRDVSARMRQTKNPVWRTTLAQNLTGAGAMEGRVLTAGARIAAGNPGQLITASSRRKIGSGGGIIPERDWPGWEYGRSGDKTSAVTNKKGTRYNRHTTRHLPSRNTSGRVIGPTVAKLLPRIASFWTQSVVRAFMDAADRKDG